MRELRKSGSVGARGGKPPWATRLLGHTEVDDVDHVALFDTPRELRFTLETLPQLAHVARLLAVDPLDGDFTT